MGIRHDCTDKAGTRNARKTRKNAATALAKSWPANVGLRSSPELAGQLFANEVPVFIGVIRALRVRLYREIMFRKYSSTPSATPRAYASWNSAVRSPASCSGIIRNAPSHNTLGIHVGRNTARLS